MKKSLSKNSTPTSLFEEEDRCPSCGSPCDPMQDLDEEDYCNDCRPDNTESHD